MAIETKTTERYICDCCGKEIDKKNYGGVTYDRRGKGTIEGFDITVTKYTIVGAGKTIVNPDLCKDCLTSILFETALGLKQKK